VNVRAPLSWPFSEIALGQFRAGTMHEAGPFEREAIGIERLERRQGHLDVDDRFRSEPWHRCRTDVIDPEGNAAKLVAQAAPHVAEQVGPLSVVRHHDDGLAHASKPATSRCWDRARNALNAAPAAIGEQGALDAKELGDLACGAN
jgi:hypothetical protein